MKILSNTQARAVQMLLQTEAPYFYVMWNDPRGLTEVRCVHSLLVVTRGQQDPERYVSAEAFMGAYAFLL